MNEFLNECITHSQSDLQKIIKWMLIKLHNTKLSSNSLQVQTCVDENSETFLPFPSQKFSFSIVRPSRNPGFC